MRETPDKMVKKQTSFLQKKTIPPSKNKNKKPASAPELRSTTPIGSKPHNLLWGQRVPLIERDEGGLSSPGSTQGRGLKTGLTSISPKRATEQKGLGYKAQITHMPQCPRTPLPSHKHSDVIQWPRRVDETHVWAWERGDTERRMGAE